MKPYLLTLSLLLLGCQAPQQEPAGATAEGSESQPDHESLSAPRLQTSWRGKTLHLSCEGTVTYRALLLRVLGPALAADAEALVLELAPGQEATRIRIASVPGGVHVNFAQLDFAPEGLRLQGEDVPDEAACRRAISKLEESYLGKGPLAIQLRVPRANDELQLQELQRVAQLVAASGCEPVFLAGDCAYVIERIRFERVMAADSVEERLRALRAHLEAYPKPPRTSVDYPPFAWEWEGEIYVGNEWTEWTHVRTGETTKPKWDE